MEQHQGKTYQLTKGNRFRFSKDRGSEIHCRCEPIPRVHCIGHAPKNCVSESRRTLQLSIVTQATVLCLCTHRIPAPAHFQFLKIRETIEQQTNDNSLKVLKNKFDWLRRVFDCPDCNLFGCADAVLKESDPAGQLKEFQDQLGEFETVSKCV